MTPVNYPFKIKQIPHNRKLGKVDKDYPHRREPHEDATAETLVRFGYDLIFIRPSKTPGSHTPDCFWRDEYWEIKSPKKNDSHNIIDAIKDGTKQSRNLIIDVSRCGRSIRQTASDIFGYIKKHRNTKIIKVLIINREWSCEITKDMVR